MTFDIDKQMESIQKTMDPGSERWGLTPMNQIGANKPKVQNTNYQDADVDRAYENRFNPKYLAEKGKRKAENEFAHWYRRMGDSPADADVEAASSMYLRSRFPKKYTPPQSNVPTEASTPKVAPQWAYTAAEPYVPPAQQVAQDTEEAPDPADTMSKYAAPPTQSFKDSFDIGTRMDRWKQAGLTPEDTQMILKGCGAPSQRDPRAPMNRIGADKPRERSDIVTDDGSEEDTENGFFAVGAQERAAQAKERVG